MWGGHGVVHRGGKGAHIEEGETDACACREGDTDSVGHLKCGVSASVTGAQPAKRVSGAGKGGGNILTVLRFACSMCRGRPHVVCEGRGEGEGSI